MDFSEPQVLEVAAERGEARPIELHLYVHTVAPPPAVAAPTRRSWARRILGFSLSLCLSVGLILVWQTLRPPGNQLAGLRAPDSVAPETPSPPDWSVPRVEPRTLAPPRVVQREAETRADPPPPAASTTPPPSAPAVGPGAFGLH